MTAPNREAVEAAANAIRAECSINPEDPDFLAAGVLALTAALPFLAPQPSGGDERKMQEAGCCSDGCCLDPAKCMAKHQVVPKVYLRILAAVRAEATLAGAVAEREACAKVADPTSGHVGIATKTRREIAASIRARK